ncbi:extracellular solute-binding protein [Burkholderia sp. Bp9017]|uniref:Extracellular solute-binding protein n=1 Tax=Burkholderia anthina TaxID=179879 RepID=A0A7T6VJ10_9BURK|nr:MULTISPECIES: extracellular solute-binding protein [Burkholderia]MBY4867812.1 extracellular solute-binding protein [Burkholderia anthina]QQK04837.1 extracellular solute-binding protein [Burkholderia anthina]RQZ31423.1 extracellular solute-binding protein [Burkholderia sp. Bp9017]RQZ37555.1 extracellular solute-binding protein [Burkholderia sp. Bp9016]
MQPGNKDGEPSIRGIGARRRVRRVLRRLFVVVALGAFCVPALAASAASAGMAADSILRVLAWPGYADQDVVDAFETQFHVHVEVTFVDSDEALWTHLHSASPPPYDVLAANTAEIQRYAREGLLAPIDLSRIPNRRRQLPNFRHVAAIGGLVYDGLTYGIPFTYSSMGLIYDRKQVADTPRSMLELWNPRYRGRVLDFNSAQHNFSFTALALGYPDPFRLSHAQTLTVAHKLIDLRRNLLTYYTLPEEATALFVQHHAALMFGNYGTQQVELLRRAGVDVGYVIPDEGALAWLDCWAVTRGAERRELAFAWINYMLEPAIGALLTERQGLANTLEPPPGLAAGHPHLVWIQPVEDIARRESLWSRIVSGDRPERFEK